MAGSARSTRQHRRIRELSSSPARVGQLCRPSGRSMESAWKPHRDALLAQVLLELAHVVNAEVENAGGECCIGATFAEDVGEMSGVAGATGGDDGNRDGVGDSGSERAVKTDASAVAIH